MLGSISTSFEHKRKRYTILLLQRMTPNIQEPLPNQNPGWKLLEAQTINSIFNFLLKKLMVLTFKFHHSFTFYFHFFSLRFLILYQLSLLFMSFLCMSSFVIPYESLGKISLILPGYHPLNKVLIQQITQKRQLVHHIILPYF